MKHIVKNIKNDKKKVKIKYISIDKNSKINYNPYMSKRRETIKMLVDSIANTAVKLKNDGYNVSETALRRWVKADELPARKIGTKKLLYYPDVIAKITFGTKAKIETEEEK